MFVFAAVVVVDLRGAAAAAARCAAARCAAARCASSARRRSAIARAASFALAAAAAARCAALARAVAAAAADTPSLAGDAAREAARAAARAAADMPPYTPFTPLTCSAGDDAAARAAAALDRATTCSAGDCALAAGVVCGCFADGVGVLPLVSCSNACARAGRAEGPEVVGSLG